MNRFHSAVLSASGVKASSLPAMTVAGGRVKPACWATLMGSVVQHILLLAHIFACFSLQKCNIALCILRF